MRLAPARLVRRPLGVGNGEVGAYWEAVRALNSGGGPATKSVVAQKFYDEVGNVRETPGENAAAAAAAQFRL